MDSNKFGQGQIKKIIYVMRGGLHKIFLGNIPGMLYLQRASAIWSSFARVLNPGIFE